MVYTFVQGSYWRSRAEGGPIRHQWDIRRRPGFPGDYFWMFPGTLQLHGLRQLPKAWMFQQKTGGRSVSKLHGSGAANSVWILQGLDGGWRGNKELHHVSQGTVFYNRIFWPQIVWKRYLQPGSSNLPRNIPVPWEEGHNHLYHKVIKYHWPSKWRWQFGGYNTFKYTTVIALA